MSVDTICNRKGFFLLCFLLAVNGAVGATPAQEEQAVEAANNWVKLIDAGSYRDAWLQSASAMRQGVNADTFAAGMASVRGKLGAVVARNLSSHRLVSRLPGAPSGKYVVVEFKTKFANRTMTERITPMLEGDGKWRVSGYYFI